MKNKVKIVILAAGKGKRMQREEPKVLSEIHGKPMIEHLRASIAGAHDDKPIAVIGHQAELVKSRLGDNFIYVTQEEQLGTGHALAMTEKACEGAEHVMVLYGDQPFIKSETIKRVIEKHTDSGATITFTTTEVPNFESFYKAFSTFARILRKEGKITAIREFRDASDDERNIKEVNAGCYVFESKWLWENLKKIDKQNAQGEYYLTDLIPMALKNNEKVESIQIDPREALGANSKEELEILENFQ
jgi:bifunctional UDP-N-acetylglucosamine pyrophosphorylase/glucosamine-1-phosphate N-acetyltransferase